MGMQNNLIYLHNSITFHRAQENEAWICTKLTLINAKTKNQNSCGSFILFFS